MVLTFGYQPAWEMIDVIRQQVELKAMNLAKELHQMQLERRSIISDTRLKLSGEERKVENAITTRSTQSLAQVTPIVVSTAQQLQTEIRPDLARNEHEEKEDNKAFLTNLVKKHICFMLKNLYSDIKHEEDYLKTMKTELKKKFEEKKGAVIDDIKNGKWIILKNEGKTIELVKNWYLVLYCKTEVNAAEEDRDSRPAGRIRIRLGSSAQFGGGSACSFKLLGARANKDRTCGPACGRVGVAAQGVVAGLRSQQLLV